MENAVPLPPVPTAPPQVQPQQKHKWFKITFAVVLAIIFFLVIAAVFRPEAASFATISGNIRYNGLRPVGSLKGKIVVVQKELGVAGEYMVANDNVPVSRGAPWIWSEALEGRTYQIQAYLEVEGSKVAYSNIINVSAPSVDQELVFNVTRNTLSGFNIPPTELITYSNSTVSGMLDLNGYIPTGSTVRIFGKTVEQSEYTLASDIMPAQDGKVLSWESATAGETYDFVGLLADANGNEIGRSSVEQIVAPSANNVLTIQSSANPPTENQKGVISGRVQLNGAVVQGSKISMRQKLPTENDFHEFTELDPVNGVEWSWSDANVGQEYDITAVLEVNGNDESQGEVLSVTAPASTEEITLDTNYSLATPTPSVEPTSAPTAQPTAFPSVSPSVAPSANPSVTPRPTITPSPVPTPTVTPTPLPTASPSPTPPLSTSSCSVKYVVTNETASDYTADVSLRNNTSSTINNWNLEWKFKGNQTVTNMWGATYTQSGNTVAAVGTSAIVGNGGQVSIGFNATYKGANNSPDKFSLNGQDCDKY